MIASFSSNDEILTSSKNYSRRFKKSERIFIHKSLLLSLGVGNLVFVVDKTLFSTRQEHAVSTVKYREVSLLTESTCRQ